MKILAVLFVALICTPAVSARLTDEDLYRIEKITREIIKEELEPVNKRIDDLNKRIDDIRNLFIGITSVLGLLIIAAIAIPPAVFYRKDRDSAVQQAKTERNQAIVAGKAAAMGQRPGHHTRKGI